MEISLEVSHETSLSGENWIETCKQCQTTIGDCCKDIELTLFPDEIGSFIERDAKNVSRYSFGTQEIWGYDNTRCCFLNENDQCELQLQGITKPIDCLIYPLNYKNGKIFLDNSCPGFSLLDLKTSKTILREKLNKFPQYYHIKYAVMSTDRELGTINE